MKYIDENSKIWDKRSENEDKWSVAVSSETGFAIVGFYEDKGGTVLDHYMNSSIATKAIKL